MANLDPDPWQTQTHTHDSKPKTIPVNPPLYHPRQPPPPRLHRHQSPHHHHTITTPPPNQPIRIQINLVTTRPISTTQSKPMNHADLNPLDQPLPQDHVTEPPSRPTLPNPQPCQKKWTNGWERWDWECTRERETEDKTRWKERKWHIYIGENKKLLFCFAILLQHYCKFAMVL